MKTRHFLSCVIAFTAGTFLFISTNSISTAKTAILPKVTTANVGTLSGSFQVTPTGQAHYSIPIDVPPGTAKMQPALAITYDSSSSNIHNGLLGMGFSLEGLTAITRCQSNQSQNGTIRAIEYSNNDRFCLNGEQLVVIKGTYGQDGAEYRTYNDTFARIISHGTQGNGPAYFTVEAKGGQIAYYGATVDSQMKVQLPNNTSVSVWSLNRIKDTVGNYLDVHYAKDESSGSFYPVEVDYTGNEKTGMQPYNAVKFIYESRPDANVTYQAGSKITLNVRLKNIQVLQAKNLVYNYNLSYETSPNSFRSRITSIQKCAGDGICLPATTFAWQTNQEGWTPAPKEYLFKLGEVSAPQGTAYASLTGNGLLDLVDNFYIEGVSPNPDSHFVGAWENSLAGWQKNSNFFPPFEMAHSGAHSGWQTYGSDSGTRIVDLRGTGYSDILQGAYYGGTENRYDFRINNIGQGWVKPAGYNYTPPVWFSYEGRDYGTRLINLTGSGLPDLVTYARVPDHNYIYAYKNTGVGWSALSSEYNPKTLVSYFGFSYQIGNYTDAGTRFIDLRGIGLDDAMQCGQISSTYSECYTYLNTGKGWAANPNPDYKSPPGVIISSIGRDAGVRFVHLTSSGLPDIIQSLNWGSGSSKYAYINTGKGWVNASDRYLPQTWITYFNSQNQVVDQGTVFADLRGTGLDDMVQHYLLEDHAYINNGITWKEDPLYKVPAYTSSLGNDAGFRFVDLTGSGLPDIVKPTGLLTRGAWLNKAQKYPDYLISITDGLGAKTTIDYEPLSGKAIKVYTKENTASYPNMDWQGPMYVVYQTITSANISDPTAIALAFANSDDQKNALNHVTTYHYIGAKLNHLGWGFLGFHQIAIKDETTGVTKTTTYGQNPDLHNVGKELASETHLKTGELIHATSSAWNFKKTHGDGSPNVTSYFSYVNSAQENGYDLSGKLLSTKTAATSYDDYANPSVITETIKDPNHAETYITQTVNKYNNVIDATHWLLGELLKSVVTSTAPSVANETHTSAFTYDNNGLLLSETTEPDDAKFTLTKAYTRDNFGNIIKTELFNSDKTIDRISSVQYEATGRFIVIATNPLGQKIYQTPDPRFGTMFSTDDLNDLTTTMQYDGFGRLIMQANPDGSKSQTTFSWVTNPPDPAKGAVYSEKIDFTGRPSVIKYYDQLNRLIAKSTQGFDGRTVWQITQYDELDRVTRSYIPYFQGDQQLYNENHYDVLGRITQIIKPDSSIVKFAYNGLTTITTNPLNQTLTKTENVRGKLISSIDNNGKSVNYKYDAYGRMLTMTDSLNHVTTMTYDKLGRKLTENDPDKGKYSYEYDSLGELIKQTDAIGKITIFQYDQLGRMVARTDEKGTSIWTYGKDVNLHNVGLLINEQGLANINKLADGEYKILPAGINDILAARKNGIVNYAKTITYDKCARPQDVEIKVGDDKYVGSTAYDSVGRILISSYNQRVVLKNEYNNYGYLKDIANDGTKVLYWQVNAMDANGNITSETHSNGLITTRVYDPATGFLKEIHTKKGISNKLQDKLLGRLDSKKVAANNDAKLKDQNAELQSLYYVYDQIGNLKKRDDNINNIHEAFTYDSLNRLKTWVATGSMPRTKSYEYDEVGNLISQSGLGNYHYGSGAGPHAVTSITDNSGKTVGTFQYDKDGNQTYAVLNGKSRSVNYTSFEKPLVIKNDHVETDFYYNANRDQLERVDQIEKDGKLLNITTINFDGYEHEFYLDGTLHVRDKVYIGPSLELVFEGSGANAQVGSYELLKDSLGSLTDITDQAGGVVRSYHYEPFGKQELVGQYKDVVPPLTHHGFTGHQEIESFDLIHMAGRIYDPIIARFLSADPYIQDPANTQSLNRYSYCINNPLAYTDPTGFDFWSRLIHGAEGVLHDIGHAYMCTLTNRYFQTAVGIALQFVPGCQGWTLFFAETSYSAFNALIAGQGLPNAFRAAFFTGIDTGFGNLMGAARFGEASIGSNEWTAGVFLEGVERGEVRVLEGGSFQDGFISGTIMQASSAPISKIGNWGTPGRLVRSAATGIIGGSIAALTGGNFGEAAKMSAFAYLYSDSLRMTMIEGHGAKYLTDVMGDGKAYPVARDIKWGPLAFIPIPIFPLIHSAEYVPQSDGTFKLIGFAPESGTGIPNVTGKASIDDDVMHLTEDQEHYKLSDYVVLNIPGAESGLDTSRVINILAEQEKDWTSNSAARYNLFFHNCHDFNDDTMKRYLGY